jgi:hypothetical protein
MPRSIQALALTGVVFVAASTAEAAPRKKRTPSAQTAPLPKPAAGKAADAEAPSARGGEAGTGRRGPSRIEFDDRLVQGETSKANAIYLFERRDSALRSLLKKRTNFHAEMDEMLEDELVR